MPASSSEALTEPSPDHEREVVQLGLRETVDGLGARLVDLNGRVLRQQC